MKFQFDPNQRYQVDAVASVVDLLTGQPADAGQLSNELVSFSADDSAQASIGFDEQLSLGAVGNNVVLSDEVILDNLRSVQDRNGLPLSSQLVDGLQFDIEMETGTGKTYVYLRTIFELARKYNLTKFIILVPNVAIREGVSTSLELMEEHFTELYPDVPFSYRTYSSDAVEEIRPYATSSNVEIMVMTIDSIRTEEKKNRVIYKTRDKLGGNRPIDYLAATRPVLILDEPQNMESELSVSSIKDFEPTMMLRYSATHRQQRNLVYRLDPVSAHSLGLVKEIVVAHAQQEGTVATPYIKLLKVTDSPWKAQLEVNKLTKGEMKLGKITVKQGEDLLKKTKNPAYAGDWWVTDFSLEPAAVTLSNFGELPLGETTTKNSDALFKEMIRSTIQEHLAKQLDLARQGIKVLTLFFVDRVSNYMGDAVVSAEANGKFAQWFDQIFLEECARNPEYAQLYRKHPSELRSAYFSQNNKGEFLDTDGTKKSDHDAYDLIMKDKARLLSQEEPVCFIFSHSSLREGWDNPNVFQICTLRDIGGETERRQTIGRGLRLPVNNRGERITDRSIAELTVFANESYTDFARGLQQEYAETGVHIGTLGRGEFAQIIDQNTGAKVGYAQSERIWQHLVDSEFIDSEGNLLESFTPKKKGFSLNLPATLAHLEGHVLDTIDSLGLESMVRRIRQRVQPLPTPGFIQDELVRAAWDAITVPATYEVAVDTGQLVNTAVKFLRDAPEVKPVQITMTRASLEVQRGGVKETSQAPRSVQLAEVFKLPNIVSQLQESTALTRRTVVDILRGADRMEEFAHNPNEFISVAQRAINSALDVHSADSVTYHRQDASASGLSAEKLSLDAVAQDPLNTQRQFIDRVYQVENPSKTTVNYLAVDSQMERSFVQLLDTREDVVKYLKLPRSYFIDTPLGRYSPDWLIIRRIDGENVVMVRETKGTKYIQDLRPREAAKVRAAQRYFAAIGVDYRWGPPEPDLLEPAPSQSAQTEEGQPYSSYEEKLNSQPLSLLVPDPDSFDVPVMPEGGSPKKIFISYASARMKEMLMVQGYLERAGHSVWSAPMSIRPGTFWPEEIAKGIDSVDAFLLLFTTEADQSKEVLSEVALAREEEKVVYPLRLDDFKAEKLRYFLATYQWVDWLDKSQEGLERLCTAIFMQPKAVDNG